MTKKLLLSISMILSISINAQVCSELFFSEYVEGSSQNKAIEVYNPTNLTINLNSYTIERYSNGATNSAAGGVTGLIGMLAPGDVFVLTNGETDVSAQFGFCDPALIALGDYAEPNGSYPTPMHMNGNDAIVLVNDGVIIDVIGKVGEDPGTAWSDANGSWWTANHTLIRKSTVLSGDDNGLDNFYPSLEWDSLPNNTWNNLGSHICDCSNISSENYLKTVSYVMYPNPVAAGGVITINSTANIKRIDIVNMLGKKVLTETSNKINTSRLVKGTYIVLITLDNDKVLENQIIVE